MSFTEFKRKYIDPITASREPKATEEVVEIGEKRGEELNRLTSSFILRRTQSVIDKFLPVKNDLVVFCEPTSTQVSRYLKSKIKIGIYLFYNKYHWRSVSTPPFPLFLIYDG